MTGRVVFDSDPRSEFAGSPAHSLEHKLIAGGVVTNVGNARIMLAVVAACIFGGAFYFLAASIPETPTLGDDIPRTGELIPSNRAL